MLQLLPSYITLFTFTLIVLCSVSLSPPVLAQNFTPEPVSLACVAFAEGQGLFVLGGKVTDGGGFMTDVQQQSFMLDLSVSWNTTDPVYKLLEGPLADLSTCTMANHGEDLFVLQKGTGYVYNLKSEKWRVINNSNFTHTGCDIAATDPETGFVYLPECGLDFQGKPMMLSLDLITNTVNTSVAIISGLEGVSPSWNVHLRSVIIPYENGEIRSFTPSQVGNSPTGGWGLMKTGPLPGMKPTFNCAASAYGNSKVVVHGIVDGPEITGYVYTFDGAKRTWKRGPPGIPFLGSACAVTGDQLILWGGFPNRQLLSNTNRAFVYNMKSEEWTSTFIAPPSQSTTTPGTSQPSQNPTEHDSLSTSSEDRDLIIIIAVVSATLLAIILGFIIRYYRRTRQSRTTPDGPSSHSLSVKAENANNPSNAGRMWYSANGLFGRLHQGSFGARPFSELEHPHAVVDLTEKRNVQEGASEVQFLPQPPHAAVEEGLQFPPQHPHAMVEGGFAPRPNDKAEYIEEDDGGKEELVRQ